MDLTTLKEKKKELKITLEEISQKSGIPINTLKNIFSERTKNPRIDTMKAIEDALGLNKTNLDFSEEEKKEFNLGDHKIALSDVDKYRLNVLARAEEVLGKEFVDAQIKLLEFATEKGLK